jgi:hypothetical protein
MTPTLAAEHQSRHANLKMSNGPSGQILTASVPSNISNEDFTKVGLAALGLIRQLTNCNCMSGRISYVVEENFADVIRVELNPQPLPPRV